MRSGTTSIPVFLCLNVQAMSSMSDADRQRQLVQRLQRRRRTAVDENDFVDVGPNAALTRRAQRRRRRRARQQMSSSASKPSLASSSSSNVVARFALVGIAPSCDFVLYLRAPLTVVNALPEALNIRLRLREYFLNFFCVWKLLKCNYYL